MNLGGGSAQAPTSPTGCIPPQGRPPGYRPCLDADPPPEADPLDAEPLEADPLDADPPWRQTPPWMQTPPPRGRNLPPVNRMTHVGKNITFPQISFAGGNHFFFDFYD